MNLLINPPAMIQSGYTPPPLGLLYLAAMDDETVVWDAALHRGGVSWALDQWQPKVVGVPVYTMGRHDSLQVLRQAKRHGAVTVAGGPHVAVMQQQMVDTYGHFIDHFVVGDGEVAWQKLCSGETMPQVIKQRVELDDLPLPAWGKVPLADYPARAHRVTHHRGNDLTTLPRISVVFGRGCSGRCAFCSTFWINGEYRHHTGRWMADNLAELWRRGVRHLVFQDDNFTDDRDAVMELCGVLAKYGFSWHATARVNGFDYEVASAMHSSGCYEISFGIESGSKMILHEMGKGIEPEHAHAARAICREVGIGFTALMMEGYPHQTPDTQEEDRAFLKELRPDGMGTVGVTWVLPGTRLYKQCKGAGLIDDAFWLGEEPVYVYQGGLT